MRKRFRRWRTIRKLKARFKQLEVMMPPWPNTSSEVGCILQFVAGDACPRLTEAGFLTKIGDRVRNPNRLAEVLGLSNMEAWEIALSYDHHDLGGLGHALRELHVQP